MYARTSVGLIIVCLFFSCGILNNKKTTAETTTPAVVGNESTSSEEENTIPSSYEEVVIIDSLPPPPKAPLEYMTIEEKAMVDEINLLRADPNAYIQYVDIYLQDFMEDDNWDFASKQIEKSAGDDLIRQLRYLAPLELLKPNEALYKVAKKHGKDMKATGVISHRGSDDSTPEDRIRDSTILIGSENLAAGGRSVRESVIMLLVDANDRVNKSHRKAILNPLWSDAAYYYVGTVDELPGTWVQLFAYPDPDDIPEEIPADKKEDVVSTGSENPSASGDFSFMSQEEKAMIDEINLMRSNPQGYIKHVDVYVKEMKAVMIGGGDPDFDTAAREVKSLLQSMPALSTLKPHKKLYEATKAHGLDNKNNNQLEHKGSDGRQSFDRVKDTGLKNSINDQGIFAPNENLVGGEANVRNSVIGLLIDAGIATRGHRKALIEPTWEYVACYQIGKIENLKDLMGMGLEDPSMKNCWVQFFAKGPDANGNNNSGTDSMVSTGTATSGKSKERPQRSLPTDEKEDVSSTGTPESEESKPVDNDETESSSPSASGDFAFMTQEEKAMIDEINLMRTNPKGYIKYVDAYAKMRKKEMVFPDRDFDKATREIKRILKKMSKLSALKPHKKLYEVTKAHGIDNNRHNQLEHEGTDGRSSFKRIKDTGLKNSINDQGVFAPNENLVGGEANVRNSVIALLIDAGISTRGHRKALIEPTWEYVACYQIGTIENLKELRGSDNPDMKNCWIQFFGMGPDSNAGNNGASASTGNTKPDTGSNPPSSTGTSESEESKPEDKNETKSSSSSAPGDFSFMTQEEKAMLDEINLMRSNPKDYIKYVDAFAKVRKKEMAFPDPDFDIATNELKGLLKSMPKLSTLKPHKKLYEVVKAHGLDNKNHNQLEHEGSDGRSSFKRIKDTGLKNSINDQGVFAPNENLVGGEANVRNSVIALLIDSGVSTRGHRKALIEPTWEYVACYQIGTIENFKDLQGMGLEDESMKNCWIQFFGLE